MVTMTDVAKLAGVSTMTVSNVLNTGRTSATRSANVFWTPSTRPGTWSTTPPVPCAEDPPV